MAKFCIHCGKPLEDGEVCNCQDNVTTNPNAQNSNNETTNPNTCNPESDINSVIAENSIASENNNSSSNEDKNQNSNSQSATNENANSNSSDTKATFEAGKANAVFEKFKFIFSKFTSFFKSPTGIAKEFADKKDSTYGILMICTNIIVTFLMFFILISASATTLYRIPILGSLISNSAFSVSLMFALIFAAYYFALAGLLVLTTSTFFKGSMKFSDAVSLVGVNAFINIIVLVVSVILMMIIPLLGMLVLYVGMIYASLMFIISYIDLADISSDKKGYALLISFVLTIVAVAIVASMAASMVGSSISNSLGGYSSYDSYSDWDF